MWNKTFETFGTVLKGDLTEIPRLVAVSSHLLLIITKFLVCIKLYDNLLNMEIQLSLLTTFSCFQKCMRWMEAADKEKVSWGDIDWNQTSKRPLAS